MEVDFLVFGHGHDGALRDAEYNGEGYVSLMAAIKAQAIGNGEKIIPQPLRKEIFKVVEHTSQIDHSTYLLAVADGYTPQNIDIKILHLRPKTKPQDI
ncbi:hypothetical protein ACY2EW_08575 [Serratia nevei]